MGVYRFEGIDDSLPLVPLAARRALDRAARKLSLERWQALSLAKRQRLVDAGSSDHVDLDAVTACLEGADTVPYESRAEPDRHAVDAAVASACEDAPITEEVWRSLRALDRWSLTSLAERGKREALGALRRELDV